MLASQYVGGCGGDFVVRIDVMFSDCAVCMAAAHGTDGPCGSGVAPDGHVPFAQGHDGHRWRNADRTDGFAGGLKITQHAHQIRIGCTPGPATARLKRFLAAPKPPGRNTAS